ncbi:MAG: hypothetical protein NZ733_00535 [Aigarchaeota archaeon]|nr:hypothetical protein [Aigarchaeota archaeon]MCX8202718.1 hypothetical protein [Nitrososphaeria archaeon]MDW8043980.1 hypothetical protein [Nitrososphaerota archaeon]
MSIAGPTQLMISLMASVAASLVLVRLSMILGERLGLKGKDVHKPYEVYVPKIGGLGMAAAYTAAVLVFAPDLPSDRLLALTSVPALSAAIGLFEDFRELNPYVKPVLLAVPGVVVVLLGAYDPHPVLPIVGRVRLTILYPLILVAAYSVVANAVNSVDVVNGSLALFAVSMSCSFLAALALRGPQDLQVVAAALLGASLGFLYYNWYPARTFSGNVGSNLVASAFLTLAVTAGLEVFLLVALLPAILNEAFIIASMGGLKSGKNVVKRPILVLGGVIRDNPDVSAPLTLVRMLAAGGDLDERRASLGIGAVTAFSCALALITLHL